MDVTFVGAGARVDSGGAAVTSIDAPRPAGLAVGDYVIVFGWADTPDDWTIPLGPDGVPFAQLAKQGRFQAWGSFLGTGFGTSVTGIDFSSAVKVAGMVTVVHRGAHAANASSNDTLSAPASAGYGDAGRAVRLFGAAVNPGTKSLAYGGGTTRVAGTSDNLPLLVTDSIWQATSPPISINRVTATASGTGTINSRIGVTVVLSQDAPPDAPTPTSPANTASIDRTVPNRFAWTNSFPLGGDSQSRFVLAYSGDAGDSGSIDRTTPNAWWDAPAGTFTDTDYQWTVEIYSAHGLVSPASTAQFFTAADHPDVPTITYPASDGTVGQADRVDWSYPSQDGYQVRRVADNAGDPDPGTIYWDSGETDDVDNLVRTLQLTFETNDRWEHVQLRIRNSGVWSDWADVRVLVSYTPPPAPVLQVFLGDDGASIDVTYTTPDPADGQPPATSVSIAYSTDRGASSTQYWASLPIAGTVNYPVPCSGLDYCFQATASADNGTTAASDWITMFGLSVDEVV